MNSNNQLEEKKSNIVEKEQVAVSLIFRNVSKEERVKLERLAKEFGRKHKKLINYTSGK